MFVILTYIHVLLLFFTAGPVPCPGFFYKGICLQAVNSTVSQDNVPTNCAAYQPIQSWTRFDYDAICQFFSRSAKCSGSIDRDRDGGRCSNYQALLAFESNTFPDVWVHARTFSWYPSDSLSPNCELLADPPGVIVYACEGLYTTHNVSLCMYFFIFSGVTLTSIAVFMEIYRALYICAYKGGHGVRNAF